MYSWSSYTRQIMYNRVTCRLAVLSFCRHEMMEHLGELVIVFICFILSQSCCLANNYGVIYAENVAYPTSNGYFCMMYNPLFHEVPRDIVNAEKYPVVDLTPSFLCDDNPPSPDLTNSAAAMARGNCTFSEKARLVQQYGGKVALIVSKQPLHEPVANLSSDYKEINITVALVDFYDFSKMRSLGPHLQVQLYSPESPRVDYNLILIWIMAVGSVVIGAFWSGTVKNQQRLRRLRRFQSERSGEAQDDVEMHEPEEEQETFDVSPRFILIFVVLMCGMLVSLYFLYDYLVYLIIVLFCIAASAALYACLKLVMIRIPCIGDCRLPPIRIPLLSGQHEVRRIVLALACLAVGIWWAIERKKDYAWILQDILGIVFCIHMMKTVRLPSLKACTILLVLLFFYDIFFVFITPLFTKSGESVMVNVATGGDSSTGEMLPMVLKVPRFANSVLSVCSLPFSLLGFGDILVPGLLVSYCHGFDLKVQSGRIYFIACSVAYGIGLLLTFVALALMSSGQPALLYLVPCTLLTTLLIGWRRRELKHMWCGELDPPQPTVHKESSTTTITSNTTTGTTTNRLSIPNGTPAPSVVNGIAPNLDVTVDNTSFSSDNEQQFLINR